MKAVRIHEHGELDKLIYDDVAEPDCKSGKIKIQIKAASINHLDIWEKVERNAMGYNDAAAAFGNNQLDAFWLFTAFPSGAVIMAAQTNNIALINLGEWAENSGFIKKYPHFSKLSVPSGTYRGIDYETPSFQDSTLWVAHSKTPADLVYKLLSAIFTEEGLKHMVSQKKTFKAMSIKNGVYGIVTPLHPGAEKFWKEKGVLPGG